jgi:hypothetical protein
MPIEEYSSVDADTIEAFTVGGTSWTRINCAASHDNNVGGNAGGPHHLAYLCRIVAIHN